MFVGLIDAVLQLAQRGSDIVSSDIFRGPTRLGWSLSWMSGRVPAAFPWQKEGKGHRPLGGHR